ncbi:MAG: hypothetical protein M3162_06900, partial [Thermoproteota archaeon]|nr:hypothetical protein [Thermoproteota archaeon]
PTNTTSPNPTNTTSPNPTNTTTTAAGPVIIGSCINFSTQNQSNNGSNTAGQQGSGNNAGQGISQSQTNVQRACTTEYVYITNIVSSPGVQQQLAQLPPNTLVQIDTLTMCTQLGDQACIDSNIDFQNVFAQVTPDAFGNWVLNGQVQNVGTVPHSNVTSILYLYDSLGNQVGQNLGLTNPPTINPMQNASLTVPQNQTGLTGTPQFFRISYVSDF